MSLLGFEHIGMTAGGLDRTIAFYCDLLGLRLVLRKGQASGELAFLDAGGGMLEIFSPAEPVTPTRDVPAGETGMRHMTFAFDDVDALVAKLEAAGVPIVERPRAAHNTELIQRVAFCRDPDGTLVELIERTPNRRIS